MKRDPLTDPRPGDVVRGGGLMRIVLGRIDNGMRIQNKNALTGLYTTRSTCVINTWRRWCKQNNAAVIKAGEEMSVFCSTCGREITDGRDEESCVECRATLCLACFEEDFICRECLKQAEAETRVCGEG